MNSAEIASTTDSVKLPIIAPPRNLSPYSGDARYLETINQFPVLTPQEEQAFARKFKEEGDMEAAQALVLCNLRYVVPIARGYMGYGLPLADLIQEGNVGLMKAVRRFDPDQGVRLMTFAVHWIKAEINDYVIKNWRIVKMATTKAQRKLFFKLRGLKKSLGSVSEEEARQIAEDLGVKVEEVLAMDARFTQADVPVELENEDEDKPQTPLALPSPDPTPEEALIEFTENARYHQLMELALENLDERSRDIIESRWLNEDSKVTLKDLAEKYGVSIERIRQIEQQAMAKMKNLMLKDEPAKLPYKKD